jgi:hypothetical protein
VEVVPEGLVLGVAAALLGSVVGLVVGTVGLEQPHKTEKHRITDIKANILLMDLILPPLINFNYIDSTTSALFFQ